MIFCHLTLVLLLSTIFLYGVIVFLGGVVVLIGVLRYFKKKTESSILEKIQSLEGIMGNQQFLYGNLNSIKQYILLHGPMEAAQYLTEFTNLLKSLSNNSKQKNITLAKEIETLLLYLELEKKRLGERLEFFQEIEPNLNTETIHVKPLFAFKQMEELIHKQSHLTNMQIHLMIRRFGAKPSCRIEGNIPKTNFIIEIPTK